MAFVIPQFPITCDVYRGPWLARALAISALPCNLGQGRRIVLSESVAAPQLEGSFNVSQLLCPKSSDVRDFSTSVTPDVIECPSGSGRWYGVLGVDDMGKGFPNEHRFVLMSKIFEELDPAAYLGLFWPAPIP